MKAESRNNSLHDVVFKKQIKFEPFSGQYIVTIIVNDGTVELHHLESSTKLQASLRQLVKVYPEDQLEDLVLSSTEASRSGVRPVISFSAS